MITDSNNVKITNVFNNYEDVGDSITNSYGYIGAQFSESDLNILQSIPTDILLDAVKQNLFTSKNDIINIRVYRAAYLIKDLDVLSYVKYIIESFALGTGWWYTILNEITKLDSHSANDYLIDLLNEQTDEAVLELILEFIGNTEKIDNISRIQHFLNHKNISSTVYEAAHDSIERLQLFGN